MDGGGRRSGELIGIRQAVAGLVDESPIGKNEFGSAGSDGAGRTAPGECLEHRAHLRRSGQRCLLDRRRRHEHPGGSAPELPQTLIIQEKEDLVLNDTTTKTHSILSVTESRNGGISINVEVVEVACIEHGIPQVGKQGTMQLISSGLREDRQSTRLN